MKAIDLFAGAGGFSEGARLAGISVVWAANHWKQAVRFHSANHSETVHACQDLQQADWRDIPRHDVQLASPACQGHTPARGKERPYHDALRSTAWAVVSCAEYHRSPIVVVENVPEFLTWALYPAWLDALNRLGYAVAPHVIDAADHGVPQHRERLFLVCTRSRNPLFMDLPKRPHVAIGDVIQWNQHQWSLVDKPGRSPATLRRIAAGRTEFGRRFVAPYYSSGSGLTGRSVKRPIGTITTCDRWAVVDGERMRMLQVPEAKAAMGFRADYVLPQTKREAMHMLGNAVCPPVAADLLAAIQQAA
jgi:DNA (cytosine-5)-methyltransferase 1